MRVTSKRHEEERTPIIRSVNFLLTLAAVVAATLLVTPLPAVAETETTNPPSATPSEVERVPVGVVGLAPSAVCSGATTTLSTATDIDTGCIRECEREERWCVRNARTRSEFDDCVDRGNECVGQCFAGELDPDNPRYPILLPNPRPRSDREAPGTEGRDEIRNHSAPRGDALLIDSERPRRPNPHNF